MRMVLILIIHAISNFCLLYFLFAVVLVNVKLLYGLPIDCTAEI